MKWGFLYQGQYYTWQKKRRGTASLHIPPAAFISFLENHDQIANSSHGKRVHLLAAPAAWRAMTAFFLLGPATPLLFQGQEYGSTRPFLYFADHETDLAALVKEGRGRFLSQFPSLATPEAQAELANPAFEETFLASKLDLEEATRNEAMVALHRDLLRIRREDPVISTTDRGRFDGAVLKEHALAVRWFGEQGNDRLLVMCIGGDSRKQPAPEPLLAPPFGKMWRAIWSSEDSRYGGMGPFARETAEGWQLSGTAATLFASAHQGDA